MIDEPENQILRSGAFENLVNQDFCAITFIWDYYQFLIGVDILSIYSHPTFRITGRTVTHKDDGYRDALCSRIGTKVEDALDNDERLLFRFNDGATIEISFRPEDRIGGGPESLQMTSPKGLHMIIGDS